MEVTVQNAVALAPAEAVSLASNVSSMVNDGQTVVTGTVLPALASATTSVSSAITSATGKTLTAAQQELLRKGLFICSALLAAKLAQVAAKYVILGAAGYYLVKSSPAVATTVATPASSGQTIATMPTAPVTPATV